MIKKQIMSGLSAGLFFATSGSLVLENNPFGVTGTTGPKVTHVKNDTNDLPEIINKYRAGDGEAGKELLVRFQPLLKKYWVCLWLGKIPRYDKEMFHFLSFFDSDKRRAAQLLSKALRKNEPEDLYQTLSAALLKTALSYNVINIGFKYILKKEIVDLTKDPLAHRTTQTWSIWDDPSSQTGKKPPEFINTSYAKEEFNPDKFVLEGSDSIGFKDLTLQERQLAKLAYLDDFDNKEIANILNLTLRQVRRIRQNTRNKLRYYEGAEGGGQ